MPKTEYKPTPDEVWQVAKQMLRLAYRYEKEFFSDNEDYLTPSRAKIASGLIDMFRKRGEGWNKSLSKKLTLNSANGLADILQKISDGELSEEAALRSLWSQFYRLHQFEDGSDSEAHFKEWASKISMPTAKQIKVEGGPVNAAFQLYPFLEAVSTKTLFNYKKADRLGELDSPFSEYVILPAEKSDFFRRMFRKAFMYYEGDSVVLAEAIAHINPQFDPSSGEPEVTNSK